MDFLYTFMPPIEIRDKDGNVISSAYPLTIETNTGYTVSSSDIFVPSCVAFSTNEEEK